MPQPTALLLALLMAGCSASPEQKAPEAQKKQAPEVTASVDGQQITLTNRNGVCRVLATGSDVDLGIPWPCDLHRTRDGKVRTIRWGQATIALVETSQPHPQIAGSCKTQIRALGFAGGKMHVSEHTSTVAQCPPFQWDEPMFKGLFGDKEPGR